MIRRLIASLALAAAGLALAPAGSASAAHKPPRPLCGETISCPAGTVAKPKPPRELCGESVSCPFDPARPWLCGRPSEPTVCAPPHGRRAAHGHVWTPSKVGHAHPHRGATFGPHER